MPASLTLVPRSPEVPDLPADPFGRVKKLVLDSLGSSESRRLYARVLDEFLGWYAAQDVPFCRGVVQAYRHALQEAGVRASGINLRLSVIRKLAREAGDHNLLDEKIVAGIVRIPGVPRRGHRIGNWLSIAQAQELLDLPDPGTMKGKRDIALLAVLLGCGLRRTELVSLTAGHIQQRDGRWVI